MNKEMSMIDAYRFYRWACNTNLVPFSEFKDYLLKQGYVLYDIQSEYNPVKDDRVYTIDTIQPISVKERDIAVAKWFLQ